MFKLDEKIVVWRTCQKWVLRDMKFKPAIQTVLLSFFCLFVANEMFAQATMLSGNGVGIATRNSSDRITEGSLLSSHATLKRALLKTRLDDKLTQVASYTVLAPPDQAFFNLPGSTFNKLLTSEDYRELENTLRYHLIPGSWDSIEIIKALCNEEGKAKIPTFHGDYLTLQVEGMRVYLIDSNGNQVEIMQDASRVTEKDGIVVHSIPQVLIPPSYE
jgi:uncharacterized surface protein with fasciclin (FAS1) repeats